MSYRKIDIGDRKIAGARALARPEVTWLPIAKLVIDEDYQRPLAKGNWTRIGKIAASFTWSHFTPLLVAPIEDGWWSIIDGQHRTHAALIAGQTEVPAMIVEMSVAEQAAAFSQVNGQVTAVSVSHLYKAGVVAGEPWALAATKAVEDAGAQLMTYNPSGAAKRARQVWCVGLIRDEIRKGRASLITLALSAIRRSEMGGDAGMWDFTVLRGWLGALHEVPRAQRRDLAAFLSLHDLRDLRRKVDILRARPDFAGRGPAGLFKDSIVALLGKWVADGGGK
jgi:hypothetical protein